MWIKSVKCSVWLGEIPASPAFLDYASALLSNKSALLLKSRVSLKNRLIEFLAFQINKFLILNEINNI